ncbi:hypothetical protein [Mycolicibacterium llatzerense]|uniref:hypothetical protein n=1 Tax=Mycolicibacterium llatzerense TaxID=280871 RepID=UPI0005BA07FD|nr:hypothetical protein [Mycolicibacterium llatzerense]MCT7368108.1 hypothetical protein [Mycolicibacterium llatzerense]
MTTAEYDDAMARARTTLAVLKRAAAELSTPGQDPDAAATVLRHLRNDLYRPDAPSMAPATRR